MDNSKTMIAAVAVLLVLGGGIFLAMSGDDDEAETTPATTSQTNQNATEQTENQQVDEQAAAPNIVELAQSSDDLSTLVAAVVEADLVGTLSSEGPFTVFAPTNAAFEDLLTALDATAEELLARDDLADILTYHVVAGNVMAADLSDGQMVETVNGGTLEVTIDGGTVTLTDANGGTADVVTADVEASNGVVHIIDAVVLP